MDIAIIPARGGSKRIPKKNIKLFCGKPIMQYSIEAALHCDIFDEIMVSTDNEEIAGIALKCGAKIPFMRSSETSSDTATTSDVIDEVLLEYQKMGRIFDYFVCIYPTAPFVTNEKIKEAMKILAESGCDSLLPVVKFSFPPQRGMIIENNRVQMKYPEHLNTRSQDLDPMYHDCGQFYCGKVDAFLKQKKLIMNQTLPFIISELEVQDIDNEEDWEIAEIKYKYIKKNKWDN